MDDHPPELSARLRAALDDLAAQGGEHPSSERLAAYHHDRLEGPEAERVQEHVAGCRHCSDLLLELARFEPAPVSEDAQEAAAWRELRERLREDHAATGAAAEKDESGREGSSGPAPGRAARSRPLSVPPILTARGQRPGGETAPGEPRDASSRRAPPPRSAWSRHAPALAAAFLLLAVGLGAWAVRLHSKLEALGAPQPGIPIVHLEPPGSTRGDRAPVEVGAGQRFVVILNPTAPPHVEHRLEITTAGGEPVWSGGGLFPTGAGTFHVELSRRLLPPGSYRLLLSRPRSEAEEFALEVAP